ncbi:MAG: hypothetical protein AABW56_03745, partial [Nanoarchaeota archaeon]
FLGGLIVWGLETIGEIKKEEMAEAFTEAFNEAINDTINGKLDVTDKQENPKKINPDEAPRAPVRPK